MLGYRKQIECLNCSQSQCFVLYGDREQRILDQAAAARVGKRAVLACARCGSRSLIHGWTDTAPYAAPGTTPRRRRRQQAPAERAT
jgi:hypothetical protein